MDHNHNSNVLPAAIITIGIVVLGIFGILRADQWVKANAVDECYKIGTVASRDENATYSTPLKEWFEACMREKGYR